MNALKIVLVSVINGVATVTFIATGAIVWPKAMVMILGAACGGHSATHYAQILPQQLVRAMVTALGWESRLISFESLSLVLGSVDICQAASHNARGGRDDGIARIF